MDPRDALRYNEHPDELMGEVPPEEWGGTLREVEREVAALDAQRTEAQKQWADSRRRASYRGTIEAARAIVARLRPLQ